MITGSSSSSSSSGSLSSSSSVGGAAAAAAAVPEWIVQGALLALAVATIYAIHTLPKKAFTKLRSRNRSSIQAKRHFVQGAQLLARARSSSSRSLARSALSSADSALSLDPRDPASHILKALSLHFLGLQPSALRSLDTALSPPLSHSLSPRERSDALFNRAQIHLSINPRPRPHPRPHPRPRPRPRRRTPNTSIDSAISDLTESVRLAPDNHHAHLLLAKCYEDNDMIHEANLSYQSLLLSLRSSPDPSASASASAAQDALDRLSTAAAAAN